MKPLPAALLLLALSAAPAASRAPTPPRFAPPEHGFFTGLPKLFARLEAHDAATRELTLTLERDGQRITRPARLDMDAFLGGGLGSPGDVRPGTRIWAVFVRGASKEELKSVRFLTAEIGLQTIHGDWFSVDSIDVPAASLTLAQEEGGQRVVRTVPLGDEVRVRKGTRSGDARLLKAGDKVRYQTRFEAGEYRVVAVMDGAGLEKESEGQRARLERLITREGVPGEGVGVDEQAGEAWLLLYRPGGDRARRLSPGDSVRLVVGRAQHRLKVRRVQPWGEKTALTLELAGSGLALGSHEPVRVHLPEKPAGGALPPGVGRATEKKERIDWLLASVYCTCPNRPDTCTGHLYTLAMCDRKGCGMPAAVEKLLSGWIDAGRSDGEVLQLLEKEQGPLLRRIHLAK